MYEREGGFDLSCGRGAPSEPDYRIPARPMRVKDPVVGRDWSLLPANAGVIGRRSDQKGLERLRVSPLA